MSKELDLSSQLSNLFSLIYFHCHPKFRIELSHQAVRALQYIHVKGPVTVHQVAEHLGCAHNTASEILRRLREKGLLIKTRSIDDERIVEIKLTEDGYTSVQEHTGLDVERLAEVLAHVSPEERSEIESGLTLLAKALMAPQ